MINPDINLYKMMQSIDSTYIYIYIICLHNAKSLNIILTINVKSMKVTDELATNEKKKKYRRQADIVY